MSFPAVLTSLEKGHESDWPVGVSTTTLCRISGLPTLTGRKPDYLKVPDLLLYLSKKQYDAFRFLKYSFLKDSRHRLPWIY